jgi:hypothetical protein
MLTLDLIYDYMLGFQRSASFEVSRQKYKILSSQVGISPSLDEA